MQRTNRISEYLSTEKNILSLNWKEIFNLKKISKNYIAQGIIKYKDYIIFSIHLKNKKSIIIFFKENIDGKLIYVNEIEMPLEATHTSDLTIHNNKLYAIDFSSNFIYEFKIIKKNNTLNLKFIRKAKINFKNRNFGSFSIVENNKITYLLVTSFNKDNKIWVFNFNDLFEKQLGFDDSLIFETDCSFFTQGLYYQKNKKKFYISVNRFGKDFIFQINFNEFLLTKNINSSIEKTFLGPGRMIEDIYVNNEYIYTSDEETNKIYKASLKEQQEVDISKVYSVKNYKYYNKLLSHRGRVRNFQENTIDSFLFVLKTGIKYIEIDIRLSADNVYFAYHDPHFKHGFKTFRFYNKTLHEIRKERYKNKKIRISTLEEILENFSKLKSKNQILAIDIKDFGEEKILLDMIKKYNLINHIIIFTWTPQVILKLNKIFKNEKISIPIYFSHVRTDSIFRYIFIPQFLNWKKYFLNFADFVLIGNHNYKTPLGKYSRGYRHVPYFFNIPDELINILKKHNGGICVSAKSRRFPSFMNNYFSKMKKLGLKISVFGPFFGELKIDKKKWFENLAKEKNIDIIFMDNLDEML